MKFGVQLPTRNELDIEKKTLYPAIITNEIKCSVDCPELMKDIALSFVEAEQYVDQVPQGSTLILNAKTGIDRSGGHRSCNQVVHTELPVEEIPISTPPRSSTTFFAALRLCRLI